MKEEIIYLNLTEIKPYENNPRHNDQAAKMVAESIQKFGFRNPIMVDKNNVIIAGHTRLKAAQMLGLEKAPVIIADDLTDDQAKALRLVDNRAGEAAIWDFDKLKQELDNIEVDLSAFDFDFEELNFDSKKEITEDNLDIEQELEEIQEPVTKLGDIYQLGAHRLMCGDSTNEQDISRLMNEDKADFILSDPPYGMKLDTDYSTIKSKILTTPTLQGKRPATGNKYSKVIGDNADFKPELIETFFDNFSYCKEMFLFGADYFAELLENKNNGSWLVWDKRKESQADAIGSEFELIWSKNKHKRRMLRHDWFGFLSSQNAKDAQHRVHPTQKPVSLLVDILTQWGNDSSIIVDLYGGSGSTLIACEQLKKRCFMMELDPKYCDIIIKRWETLTGQHAEKIN